MTTPAPTLDGAPQPVAARRPLGRLNLEVRQSIAPWLHGLILLLSVLVGMAISVTILAASGVDVSGIYREFVLFTFFDRLGLSSVLIQCAPLFSSASARPWRSASISGTSASRASSSGG